MQPILRLLSPDLVARILDEAFQLLKETGVKVQLYEARQLFADTGAEIDEEHEIVRIPEKVIRKGLETTPSEFWLYDRTGNRSVHYGGDSVHFDPGSCGVHYLDPDTLEHRPSVTGDLVRFLKVAEKLPAYDAVSTSAVCSEVPNEIGDLYRLYLALLYTSKPIVTGSFSIRTTQTMIDMLALFPGGRKVLAEKPLAVFDVCPTPPLIWSEFGAKNLIDLARAGVPAEMVSMPLAGAGSPVTILGSVVQHTAESLSGLTIHQLANPGAPIVWGGAPAIFDMREGTTPMGAIETAMMDASYSQVGKSLGLPTHAYMGATDSKVADFQGGMESGMTAMIGALAGINMISGAGMLDFLACISAEKLVMDAEVIGMAKRMVRGVDVLTEPLALSMFEGINFRADFLKHKSTRMLFAKEQFIPSGVIDRKSIRAWSDQGKKDTWQRARGQTEKLLADYKRPDIDASIEGELIRMVETLGKAAGMEKLPNLGE
jgi:trimethylamine--corrinoid protein Co-methyltransferase